MDAHDERLLVIGPVEDAYPAAFRQAPRVAPQKVVIQLFVGRLLEAEYLASLRVQARHHVLDHAVLARCIHGLQNDQDGVDVVRVQALLRSPEPAEVLLDECLRALLERVAFQVAHLLVAGPARVVLLQAQPLAGLDPELLLEILHRHHCSSLYTSAVGGRRLAGCLPAPGCLYPSPTAYRRTAYRYRRTADRQSPADRPPPTAHCRPPTSSVRITGSPSRNHPRSTPR